MQNQTITKYCYLFEKEDTSAEQISSIFGDMDSLHDSAEKAESEMRWDQTDDENWFKRLVKEKGQPYVAAVDFVDGIAVNIRKV